MLALSAQCGYRLHGVATDASGLIPESLDRAFTETQARVLYCMPTLQTPTGTVMPPQRRQAIAEIVRKPTLFCWKMTPTDICFAVTAAGVPTIPERSFTIVEFAKMPGAGPSHSAIGRAGGVSDRSIKRCAHRLDGGPCHGRSGGKADLQWRPCRQAKLKRDKAALRDAIVRRILKAWCRRGPQHQVFTSGCRCRPRR